MIQNKIIRELTTDLEQMIDTGETAVLFPTSNSKDITVLYSVLNKLFDEQQKLARVRIEEREQYQQMLANISHDLRTPLTVVKGMLELVDVDAATPNRNDEYLLKINEKVEEVQAILQQFFDLSKLESNDVHMEFQRVQVVPVCKEVVLELYQVIEAAGIILDLQIPSAVLEIYGDPSMLRRVLENLLTNAIKYGSDGKYLGLEILREQDYIKIVVTDKGKGIEAKYHDAVFERLFTLEDSRNKANAGSGLGLTITKRLVTQLGGQIHVTSIPHQQTSFIVTLPAI